jgi:hypothetical protein
MAVRFDDRLTLSRVARIPFSLVRPRARPAISQYRRVGSVSGSANDSPRVEYPFVEEWCRQHVLSLGQPSPPITATTATDDRRRLPAAKGLQINPFRRLARIMRSTGMSCGSALPPLQLYG